MPVIAKYLGVMINLFNLVLHLFTDENNIHKKGEDYFNKIIAIGLISQRVKKILGNIS